MCSFFGLNEKFHVKIDEIVKKFEDRLADIEDKQDSDYESNKSRFNEMEDKIDDLTNTISSQQQNYDRTIKDLQRKFFRRQVARGILYPSLPLLRYHMSVDI